MVERLIKNEFNGRSVRPRSVRDRHELTSDLNKGVGSIRDEPTKKDFLKLSVFVIKLISG